ncbi:MAG TPA: helix-turn-helix domain-containing protein [Acetobacteraceae bacterium]|nr:helix-turn-helix domain-containing protein [Acetobacteraceae bacterium]
MIADATDVSPARLLPRSVRRGLEAMHADLEREWSVADLAVAAGVSARTLQRQFREFLGKTPGTVLRDIRFERARRALLRGLPNTRIMEVALGCGLSHFGRFSVDYRRRYGETPSQTLQRQAVVAGTLAATPSFFAAAGGPTLLLRPIETNPENSELARSIADDVATALTRAGVAVTRQGGSANYHLAGDIRGRGLAARLAFRLTEAETGRHLAAYRIEGPLEDDVVPREHLAARIAAALQPGLRQAEIDRACRKPDVDLGPDDLALRALPHVLSLNAEGNARALDLLERAMDRDPDHALATALAAWTYGQRVVYHFAHTPAEDRVRGTALARRAQVLAGDATALAVLGNALTFLHDLDTAEVVVRKALACDGGSAWAWSRSGWIDVYRGDAEAAIERFKIALDLAPNDPLAFNSMVGIGCAQFGAGRYAEAARWQQRALMEHPSASWIHRTMCPAYVLIGAQAEAHRSVSALRRHYPELTVSEVQQGLPPLPRAYCDLVFDALHTVGLPS